MRAPPLVWIILLWSPPNLSHQMYPLVSKRWIITTCGLSRCSQAWCMALQQVGIILTEQMCISRRVSRTENFFGKGEECWRWIPQLALPLTPGASLMGELILRSQSSWQAAGAREQQFGWNVLHERLRLFQHLRLFSPEQTPAPWCGCRLGCEIDK